MRKFQEKALTIISDTIKDCGFEPVLSLGYSNVGIIGVQKENVLGDYASVSFNFQTEYATYTLTVGGKQIPSQPGRNDYFTFYLKSDDVAGYQRFINTLKEHLFSLPFHK